MVRLRDRDRLTVAHRRHLYQLLANQKGVAHWKISVGYGMVNLGVGAATIFLRGYGLWWVTAAFLAGCFGLSALPGSLLRNRLERVKNGTTEAAK